MKQKGRPAQQLPVVKSDLANGGAIAQDFAALDKVAAIDSAEQQADEAALAVAAQTVGGALMARLHTQFSAAAEIRMFEQIRDLPRGMLKRIPIRRSDGTSATAETQVAFCPLVFGKPYTTMEEASRNFAALGEPAYEAAVALGINRSAFRATRTLPPEKRELVIQAIESGSTKAEVMSVIEDLAEGMRRAEAERDEAKAEKEAGEHLLGRKNKRIDALEAELRRFDKGTPDEQLAEMQRRATALMNELRGGIAGGLRQACVEIGNHGEERGRHDLFLAGLVGQVQHELALVRQEFNLPDISHAESELQAGAREAIRAARQARSDR